jgi:hypothetical protein
MLPPGTRFSKSQLSRDKTPVGFQPPPRVARFLFYVFVVIFLILLILGLTIFRV